ncbi:HST [Symbiodinium natans]|uniref:HST protein n=1 Tax=Symbiodinium natans TaxID=878477 RepID=A0A812GC47_9DINO|nr:HST [Symbiodinium natans]
MRTMRGLLGLCLLAALLWGYGRDSGFLVPSPRGAVQQQFAGKAPTRLLRRAGSEGAVEEEKSSSLKAFWKFLRPHTIRGTILGSSAMVSRAVIENGQAPDWSLLPTAALGVLALLCGNGYIVGINQIYDVSIDVINKPFLPVAAKELSIPQAWVLIILMAVCGTGLAFHLFGPLIGSLYAFGLFLGTIYSVPSGSEM